jgi:two-component system OmpR family response regulator
MARILVVDDDPHLRELLAATLRGAGFTVREAADGGDALASLDQDVVDLVVLDLMLPGMDGWTLCRRIRETGPLPIVMVTARGTVDDKVRGLGLGADDYVTKPFAPAELVARVQSVLRRFHIATAQEVRIGGVHLDGRAGQATWDGCPVPLRPKEFALLFTLARDAGRTVLRERLLEEVWGVDFAGDERTLDVHIKRLRERFPPDRSPFRIETARGLGYRLEVNR